MSQIPNDIPGNSHKEQEAKQNQQDKPQKPEVVPFEGEVGGAKRKKSGFWAWMRRMFLSDRSPKEIMVDVLENQIVPGIKDNFRNSVVSSIDMFVYQSAKPAGQNTGNNSISYNNIFRSQQNPPKTQNNQPQNQGVDLSNGFVNPCFKTRIEAERFLNGKMKSYNYPTLSVHTMYMMMNKHIDYTWDAYGWTKEEISSWDPNKVIVRISGTSAKPMEFPWMIDLPQAHVIS